MDPRLADRHIPVTGGTRGIGLEIARQFRGAGAAGPRPTCPGMTALREG